MVTVLTFGLITPSQSLLFDAVDEKSPKRDTFESDPQEIPENEIEIDHTEGMEEEPKLAQLLKEAEEQSYQKFGNRIKPVIEDEFKEVILPNIERAIEEVTSTLDSHKLARLAISEASTKGDGEKIFHITDLDDETDIIRFHVRRDHPPQAGYWFNFHYHTYHDDFLEHHDLGSIYWDKNTPPKWMS